MSKKNQLLQQQVTQLTKAFHNSIPDEEDENFVVNEEGNKDSSQWFDYNVEHGAVEESKEPRVKLATQTTPATAEHNIVKARMVYKPPQQTMVYKPPKWLLIIPQSLHIAQKALGYC